MAIAHDNLAVIDQGTVLGLLSVTSNGAARSPRQV
jgi:hypothetical protein